MGFDPNFQMDDSDDFWRIFQLKSPRLAKSAGSLPSTVMAKLEAVLPAPAAFRAPTRDLMSPWLRGAPRKGTGYPAVN